MKTDHVGMFFGWFQCGLVGVSSISFMLSDKVSFEKAFGDQISLSGDHFTEGSPQKEISENLEVGAMCN